MRSRVGDGTLDRGRGFLGGMLFGLALLFQSVLADNLPRGPLPDMPNERPVAPHPSGMDLVSTHVEPQFGGLPAPPPRTRISLNTASNAELESLPGIGPALASRIVAGRPYRSVADLERVRGIGPKTLLKLSPRVRP